MSTKTELFQSIGEPYAAGLFEEEDRTFFARYSRAVRRYWEACSLHDYDRGPFYPCGPKLNDAFAVFPDYSFTFDVNEVILGEKSSQALAWMQEEKDLLEGLYGPHNVGGGGYTHSIPNFGRVAREGLDSYEERILRLPDEDFRNGLLDVLAGIRNFHARALCYLREMGGDPELISALETVPFRPAQSLYEALVCWNFVFYVDFCDNPGRLDIELFPFYKDEDSISILKAFFQNVDRNSGWSTALGPDCNALTLQCLKAIKGLRRPSLELRVTDDTPDEIWEAASAAIFSGCGQPAFYNEALYQKALRLKFPYIPLEDLAQFNGGGCTETMLAGISNVGSMDAGVNLALVFSESLPAILERADNFEQFYALFLGDARAVIDETLDSVSRYQQMRAKCRPQPVRSLLIDDCIDKGVDFNAGGARHYWSVINVAGLINVIDSLLAVRKLVYQEKAYSSEKFIDLLEKEDDGFYRHLKTCPCYGVDDPDADALAAQIAQDIWASFVCKTPFLGGAFLPASIQFATYTAAGEAVGPTPDGRKRGEPLCDSISAIHGRDTKGPTAMLASAACLHLDMALGTPVTNIRLNREHVKKALKPLVQGYFKQGGMQLQISCISKADILDALKNPQKHENLIVRIGGYSEYFSNLSPELKQTVINRTAH